MNEKMANEKRSKLFVKCDVFKTGMCYILFC